MEPAVDQRMSLLLQRSFYLRPDVVGVAQELLGKVIVTELDGERTAGVITETEAYAGAGDRASHAYGGRRTLRNAPMYAQGGTAYVYLCYGIHHLFNVVTNVDHVPHAVLVRGIAPLDGHATMLRRRRTARLTASGPGTLTQALGITTALSNTDLIHGPVRVEDHGVVVHKRDVIIGPRIGVDYAGEDALLPYRFRVAPSQLLLPNAE